MDQDVVVVGGGAAGLSAALMLGRSRRRTLVLDAGLPRNRFAGHMHGVLGRDGTDPAALLADGRAELAGYGVTVREAQVATVEEVPGGLVVVTADGARTTARALVVATGLADELPDVPGLAAHWGTGVLHCPYCHGWEVRDRRLAVLATSPEHAAHVTPLVRQLSRDVVLLTGLAGPLDPAVTDRLRAAGVRVVEAPVVGVSAEAGRLVAVRTDDGDVPVDAVFTAGRPRPHDGFLDALSLARTGTGPAAGMVAVDPLGRTSHPRVWAAGNVVDPAATVPLAVARGSFAGAAVNAALAQEDVEAAASRADERAPGGAHVFAHGHGHRDEHGHEHDHAHGRAPVDDDEALALPPRDYWERRYGARDAVWSGRPNAPLVDAVTALGLVPAPAGATALDLGCGEGGDVVWLAQQGWRATGVDISEHAVARGAAAAAERGVGEAVRFVARDLSTWDDAREYDLVSSCFLQSPVALDRAAILRAAAGRVAVGGHLLVVAHAAPPSWARGAPWADQVLPTVESELAALALDERWELLVAEVRDRDATGPDGRPGHLRDVVVLAHRTR